MSSKKGHLREFGKFRLDAEKKVLWFADEPVNLQLKEIELLCVLTENSGEVVTKDELLNRVWKDSFVEESNLARHIYRIRKVFSEHGEAEELIKTVPRRGYRFTGEIREERADLIIEKHSISQTLIEELENSVEPNVKTIPRPSSPVKARRFLIPAVICLIIFTTAFGYYFYNRAPVSAPPIRSIAVLPLQSLEDEEDKALGLGFADTLVTHLGKVEDFKVVSIKAVSRFADEAREPIEIGRKLNVDAVIDGTLQKANGKFRVTLRLIRIADGKQIWSDSFDESEAEIFRLQDLMAVQTAQALAVNLKDTTKPPTANQEAYKFYLQGLYMFRRRGGTGNQNPVPMFKRAIELDPKFAGAWAMLAGVYAMGAQMPEAGETVNRALELEPDLAEAHAVRGFIKIFLDWDWAEAEKSLNRAVELDGNSVEAHHWRGILFQILGRHREATRELSRALELDPTSANMTSDLGDIYFFAGEYEKAEELFNKAETMELTIAVPRLHLLYLKQGREREAYLARAKICLRENSAEKKAKCENTFRTAYEKGGTTEMSRTDLEYIMERIENKTVPAGYLSNYWFEAAFAYSQLGEKEKAADAIARSLEAKQPYETMNFRFPFIAWYPNFENLRDEPKFQQILQKMNLD